MEVRFGCKFTNSYSFMPEVQIIVKFFVLLVDCYFPTLSTTINASVPVCFLKKLQLRTYNFPVILWWMIGVLDYGGNYSYFTVLFSFQVLCPV